MKPEPVEVIRGSGNVYRDLGQDDAEVRQFKALLAAEIIKKLDRDGLTVLAAHARTGIAAADLSRIRHADLSRFTLDRLVGIVTGRRPYSSHQSHVGLTSRLRPSFSIERTDRGSSAAG